MIGDDGTSRGESCNISSGNSFNMDVFPMLVFPVLRMRDKYPFFTFTAVFLVVLFSDAVANNTEKRLELKKTVISITVDGVIDDVWSTADSVEDFFQLQPYFNQPPSHRTIAKVLTTDEALYCLMVCYAPRDELQINTGLLDQNSGDIVSIMLDTFNDRRTAYKFAVTASGVRADCRLVDDARNRDYSWDGVWFSGTQVHDWGFVVEMEIPYKSIKYDNALTEWGLDFDRWTPRNSEDLYWCDYERSEGQRISKFGKLLLDDFRPGNPGLNLEIYPVGFTKSTLVGDDRYDTEADVGLDIFYNPSEILTLQFTANPDFAQIEADPYEFNISRYETFFDERRPFFTAGNEVFMASGRERNSGFYRPLTLFYSRRIGRLLPDGSEVPLIVGTKATGRAGKWEYGGFYALTGEKTYLDEDDEEQTELGASFVSGRVKKQIMDNSSVGILFVGKRTSELTSGVIDIDGAFRGPTWQLAYQFARSVNDGEGGYAGSAGFRSFTETWFNAVRGNYITEDFDISTVGFVPWQGTGELVALTGPVWNFDEGALRQMLLYGGGSLSYEKVDNYTDHSGFLGLNMQFRNNWGYEINANLGTNRDSDVKYRYYEVNLSSWFNISPSWYGNLWGGYEKTYNFSRDYLAAYSWLGTSVGWNILQTLNIGTSYNMFIEGNPDGKIENITYNARPYFSLTPFNDLNVRVYTDFLYVRSTRQIEHVILGILFSYNFLPKSWIYFAINDVRDRSGEFNAVGNPLPARMHVVNRAAVLKMKYLYYF